MRWGGYKPQSVTAQSLDSDVGNLVKFRSNQEEIESNMEKGGERIDYSVETKEKVKKMHKSYADIVHK